MKKLESGRSMVEMLGVLAIIGVLSIGGIAGYTMAMNRNRANKILDAATKLSTIAYARGQSTTGGAFPAGGITLTSAGLESIDGVDSMTADENGIVNIALNATASTTPKVKAIIETMIPGGDITAINFGHN